MSDISQRLKKIVVEYLGVSEAQATDDVLFLEDLGADSLDAV